MSGYIFFERTGVKEVDELLGEIESAGSSYHSTSQWNDENEYGDKKTCIERIFEKAQKIAHVIEEQLKLEE